MKIAVIGCGNMARSIVEALHSIDHKIEFVCYTPSQKRAIDLARAVNGYHVSDCHLLLDMNIDYWLIGFKPHNLRDFIEQNPSLLKEKKIISMLAGTLTSTLKKLTGASSIVRIMPNTPISLKVGITLWFSNSKEDTLKKKMSLISKVIEVDNEDDFRDLTFYTGCAPAYIFYFAQIISDKLSNSIGPSKAREVINQLFIGSSTLMDKSKEDLSVMVDAVTSKGGVTIEGLRVLQESFDSEVIENMFQAVIEKDELLSRQ